MKYANQVKLYEYFALGKPVVSSRIPELQAPNELIYFATEKEEYLEQIDRALTSDPPEMVQARIDFAHKTNWAARTAAIDRALRDHTPLVSVVVLTYNSSRFLPSFHHHFLKHSAWPNWELIYADNGSTDGTRNQIHDFASNDERVRALLFDENLGFAGGNNAAARAARGEYLILLNPDTIVTPGWIGRLIHALERDCSAGLATPVTNLSSGQNRLDVPYRDFDGMMEFAAQLARSRFGESVEIPFAPLFCAALSRDTWDSAGELDERFRVGMFEDDDYSRRIAQSGLRIVTAEDCFVHHFGGGSFNQMSSQSLDAIFQENKRLFEEKWNCQWRQSSMRPGVPPVESARSFDPVSFFLND